MVSTLFFLNIAVQTTETFFGTAKLILARELGISRVGTTVFQALTSWYQVLRWVGPSHL
jgi:hypothetical protein